MLSIDKLSQEKKFIDKIMKGVSSAYQKYMFFIAFFGNMYLYIQAYKIAVTKVTAGVSSLAFLVTLIASSSWSYYGWAGGDPIVRISSTLGIIGSLLVLYLLNKYSDEEPVVNIKFDNIKRSEKDVLTAYSDKSCKGTPWYLVTREDTVCTWPDE